MKGMGGGCLLFLDLERGLDRVLFLDLDLNKTSVPKQKKELAY